MYTKNMEEWAGKSTRREKIHFIKGPRYNTRRKIRSSRLKRLPLLFFRTFNTIPPSFYFSRFCIRKHVVFAFVSLSEL